MRVCKAFDKRQRSDYIIFAERSKDRKFSERNDWPCNTGQRDSIQGQKRGDY